MYLTSSTKDTPCGTSRITIAIADALERMSLLELGLEIEWLVLDFVDACWNTHLSDALNADSSPTNLIFSYGPSRFMQGPLSRAAMIFLCSGVPNLFTSYCHLARHWKPVKHSVFRHSWMIHCLTFVDHSKLVLARWLVWSSFLEVARGFRFIGSVVSQKRLSSAPSHYGDRRREGGYREKPCGTDPPSLK